MGERVRPTLRPGSARHPTRGRRRRFLGVAVALSAVAVASASCSAWVPSPPGGSRPATDAASPTSRPDDEPRKVEFSALLEDPERLLGEPVRVTGTAQFIALCPPPGGSPAPCELVGYLAPPGTEAFTASDTKEAIRLAENGTVVGCAEGTQPSPACGDWRTGAEYELDGVLGRQVLGGVESDALQFDVLAKRPTTRR